MKICEKCVVSVNGNFEKCPLCQHRLIGEGQSENVFPFIPLMKHKHSFLYKMVQLCSAMAVIIAVFVNLMLPQSGFWSLFVIAGVACMWISLIIAVRKRHNILKNLAYQVNIVSALSILWDVFTGWYGWSIDFVVPIAFASVMAATTILARVLKMQANDYMVYMCLLIFYGIIPAIFIGVGLSTIIYPSLICVAASLLSLAALLIFEGSNMMAELKRRLHL